jgi:hypothetical protein
MRVEDKSARTYRTPVFGKPGPALPAKGRVKGSRTNRKNCAAPSSRRRPGPSEQWRNLAVAREPKNTPPGARRYRITLPPVRPSPESEEGTRFPEVRATGKPLQTLGNCRNGNVQLYVVHREQTREGCGPVGDWGDWVKFLDCGRLPMHARLCR